MQRACRLTVMFLALGRGVATAASSSTTVLVKQLTLEAADAMANAALAEASLRKFKNLSVCVVDLSGRELIVKAHPNCPRLIPELARAKAGAAIGMHASSRALRDKYLPDKAAQLLATTVVGAAAGSEFIAVPGGVLCRDADGDVVGAIGVSGASADEDEHCAIAGVEAVGLSPEPVQSQID
ncbi:hypothetical protein M885DRAFT_506020 [Pelagophyceae sp. CCMP2097]|nr:hypothetical protein M885DRAFT_506020 [Pelagophyceae sp. CCMP2097]